MSLEKYLGENLENLNDVLIPYVEDIVNAKENLVLKGKTYKEANMEQAQWMSYYDERKVELKTILEYVDIEIERIRTKLIRGFEKHPRNLSDTMRRQYVNNEPELLNIQKKRLVIQELYGKYVSLVDAFKQRGYSLRNLTILIQANVEDSIL